MFSLMPTSPMHAPLPSVSCLTRALTFGWSGCCLEAPRLCTCQLCGLAGFLRNPSLPPAPLRKTVRYLDVLLKEAWSLLRKVTCPLVLTKVTTGVPPTPA